MIFDSKGKIFGKVSIVDAVVVLLILAAVVGAYFRFNGSNAEVVANDEEFFYTIQINNIRAENKDLLLKSIGTPFKLSGKISSTMGELIDATAVGAESEMIINDGTVIRAAIPERYDVTLQFKVLGKVNEYGFYTPEMHEICAAKDYDIKNIYCSVTGMVLKVWSK